MIPKTLNDQISRGRAQLIMRDPFYASIIMDMNVEIDDDRTTSCATDGEVVIFNRDWLAEADPSLVTAALRKMALHVALSHHLRRGKRELPRWQEACTQAALHIMSGDNVALPVGAEADPQFAGMTAEAIYTLLREQEGEGESQGEGEGEGEGEGRAQASGGVEGQGEGQGEGEGQGQGEGEGQGEGQGQGGGAGQVLDSPSRGDAAAEVEAQRDNDQRVMRAAMAAKAAGNLPDSAERIADEIRKSAVDWREKLHEFIDNSVATDFAWSRPNRRHIHQGVYLPGAVADGLSTVGFVIDTSGSIDDETLARFFGEINAARDAMGIEQAIVVYCDAAVQRVEFFGQGEEIERNPKGGGGTDMAPAMLELRKHDCSAVVCLTDGLFRMLDTDPHAPALFVIYGGYIEPGELQTSFGDAVALSPAE